jgi:hypothetical protein
LYKDEFDLKIKIESYIGRFESCGSKTLVIKLRTNITILL